MSEVTWGVRRSYHVSYNDKQEAEYEVEEYGGELVYSEDGGITWNEAA